ncbi:MAG TPA: GNAT family N-acetyltransferase [Polyangiaceae bacterium]|nr:GNAT family N-acetyltransferase [Polyangiaceae bacterium]
MSSFVLSSATAADYPAFARLFPELGVVDPLPTADLFAGLIAPQSIVAREGETIVGFAWSRPRGEQWHVVVVITDPAYRRRGVGRALMKELAKRGRAMGFDRWMLRVKPENLAARGLYEACGLRSVLEGVRLHVAWADLARLPLPPAGTLASSLAAADDPRFEHALDLAPGELSSYRALRPERLFVGASTDGVPVACVAFDPALPGATGFWARSPGCARAVLEALLPHASPEHSRLFVSLEGDPVLEATLVGTGATVTMRTLRMAGDISGETRAAQ